MDRVRNVCGRYRGDFSTTELVDYLRAHVSARACPVVSGMVGIIKFHLRTFVKIQSWRLLSNPFLIQNLSSTPGLYLVSIFVLGL